MTEEKVRSLAEDDLCGGFLSITANRADRIEQTIGGHQ